MIIYFYYLYSLLHFVYSCLVNYIVLNYVIFIVFVSQYINIIILEIGQWIDCKDTVNKWCRAKVFDIKVEMNQIKVHYDGWSTKWDEWIENVMLLLIFLYLIQNI